MNNKKTFLTRILSTTALVGVIASGSAMGANTVTTTATGHKFTKTVASGNNVTTTNAAGTTQGTAGQGVTAKGDTIKIANDAHVAATFVDVEENAGLTFDFTGRSSMDYKLTLGRNLKLADINTITALGTNKFNIIATDDGKNIEIGSVFAANTGTYTAVDGSVISFVGSDTTTATDFKGAVAGPATAGAATLLFTGNSKLSESAATSARKFAVQVGDNSKTGAVEFTKINVIDSLTFGNSGAGTATFAGALTVTKGVTYKAGTADTLSVAGNFKTGVTGTGDGVTFANAADVLSLDSGSTAATHKFHVLTNDGTKGILKLAGSANHTFDDPTNSLKYTFNQLDVSGMTGTGAVTFSGLFELGAGSIVNGKNAITVTFDDFKSLATTTLADVSDDFGKITATFTKSNFVGDFTFGSGHELTFSGDGTGHTFANGKTYTHKETMKVNPSASAAIFTLQDGNHIFDSGAVLTIPADKTFSKLDAANVTFNDGSDVELAVNSTTTTISSVGKLDAKNMKWNGGEVVVTGINNTITAINSNLTLVTNVSEADAKGLVRSGNSLLFITGEIVDGANNLKNINLSTELKKDGEAFIANAELFGIDFSESTKDLVEDFRGSALSKFVDFNILNKDNGIKHFNTFKNIQNPEQIASAIMTANAAMSNQTEVRAILANGGISSGDVHGCTSGVWAEAFGGYGKQDSLNTATQAGFTAKYYGLTVGTDTMINPGLLVGLSGTVIHTKADMKDFRDGDKNKVNTYGASVYFSRTMGNMYVAGNLGVANNKVEDRAVFSETIGNVLEDRTVNGDYDRTSMNASMAFGYNFDVADGVTMQPELSLNYNRLADVTYRATGTSTLVTNNNHRDVDLKAQDSLKLIGNLKAIFAPMEMGGDMRAVPSVGVFGGYDFTDKKNGKSTTTQITGTTPLITENPTVEKSQYIYGAEAAVKIMDGSSREYGLDLRYNGAKKYHGFEVRGGIKLKF